ncbi:hypothetical protein ACFPIK_15450 [Algoriphagus aquatilis]|uniref:Uncharacterized protein n=1 Tax=Algoriphagus aquatilis TaxID=490186 RepID=A0ABW0C0F0_9BACT
MKNRFLIPFLFLFPLGSFAQVSLSPTSVFTDANGIGTLYVTNASDKAQEVNISFLFGYLGNDSLGNQKMIYQDSVKELQSGLGDRIRTFPKSFILAAGQQQTVRFQVRPDKNKPSGVYFTRVKISSNEQTSDVEDLATEVISTKLNLKFEQIIAAFYKSGNVFTGLEFNNLVGSRNENSILINSEFKVTGNSPYLGSVQAEVKDSSGKIVATHQQTLALYFEGKRNFTIPLPEEVASGTYQVQLVFKTERSDIPTADLVQAAPILKTFTVEL